eukprot:CAMPEP_0117455884 /NCGR_PEP_ID=MMETSP0759-20121206/11592_1 /TAXON_ID=63605 /ORGANISM="Percolomonas cosmopolitus, Strain WS" /LENGTH=45 /DNA_ID= /DNA_START= /DNA_END= /DNA_ORIENTATION=
MNEMDLAAASCVLYCNLPDIPLNCQVLVEGKITLRRVRRAAFLTD